METLVLLKSVITELRYAKEPVLHIRYKSGTYRELNLVDMITIFIDKQLVMINKMKLLAIRPM